MRRLDPQKVVRSVGRRVAALRQARGLTQEALAAELGISVNYVQRVEIGGSNMTLFTLVKWANWLGVEPAALFEPVDDAARRGRPKRRR